MDEQICVADAGVTPRQADGLGQWDSGPVSVDDVIIARMAGHPRFAASVHALMHNMMAAGAGDKALDGIFKDAGRYAVTFIALHLHFTGGLTLPRLKALSAVSGLSSPGRARAVLLYLRYLGFVTRAAKSPGASDLFVPTARCHKAWAGHMKAALEAAAVIDPAALAVCRAFERPDIYASFSQSHIELMLGSFAYPEKFDHPFVKVFMHRHAGNQILWSLMLADESDSFPPRRTRAVPAASLAERFGVSRTHVRRMIESAERQALLSQDGDVLTFTESCRAFMTHLYATQLVWLLVAAGRTLNAHPECL